jgi:hypothetical protein
MTAFGLSALVLAMLPGPRRPVSLGLRLAVG